MIMRLRWLGTTLLYGFGLVGIVAFTLLHARIVQASGVHGVVPPGNSTAPFAPCAHVYTGIQQAINAAAPGAEIRVAGAG